jgi:hypothetical protein
MLNRKKTVHCEVSNCAFNKNGEICICTHIHIDPNGKCKYDTDHRKEFLKKEK